MRAASLLAFMLSLPLAFLALVPSGAVAPALYDVIRVISALFPFKPTPRRAGRGAQRHAASMAEPLLHLAALFLAFGGCKPAGAAALRLRRAERLSLAVHWSLMAFPATRLRRLRQTGLLRAMVRETELTPSHLVQPLFVQLGEDARTPIEAMPGVERLSISHAVEEAGAAHALGVPAVLLFGIPAEKDAKGSGAYDDEGVVQLAVRAIKDAHPELVVITDVCLCAYTDHGHCGVVRDDGTGGQRRVARAAGQDRHLARRARARTPWRPAT